MAYDRLDELQILCGSLADLSEEMEVDLGHLPYELVGKYIQGTRGLADDITREIYEWRSELAEAAAALEPPAEATPEPEPEPQDDASEKPVEHVTVLWGDTIIEGEPQGFAPTVEAEPVADPIWNEPEPAQATTLEADALAKALDYYDPKAVAERERRNPFNIFKREGDQ